MFEGLDWQAILVGAIAILSMINGLSVLQNAISDRPKLTAEPVDETAWMWWSEIIDESHPEPVRRYVVIGNLGLMNIGRRPTSVAETELTIRLKNLKRTSSSNYRLPPPDIEYSTAGTQRPAIIGAGTRETEFKPLLQSGETISGLHCFLYAMYGSELWAPKTEGGQLEGTLELTDLFGKSFKSKLYFNKVPIEALEAHFPNLTGFIEDSFESEIS